MKTGQITHQNILRVLIAGFALVITASGAVNARTVVLLTAAEVDAAVKAPSTYRPPGS